MFNTTGPAAPGGKGDTAPIGSAPTGARPAAPGGATPPRDGIQPGLPPGSKSQTMRIELDDVLAAPRAPADRKNVTMPISELLASEPPAPTSMDRKNVTMPISELITSGTPPPRPIDRKNVTMPISDFMSAEPSAKSKTGPLTVPTVAAVRTAPPAAAGPGRDNASKKTTHMNLGPVLDEMPPQEAKRSTNSITVIPQTIRLKRTSGLTQAVPPPPKSQTDLIREAPTLGRMPDLSQAKMVTARILVEPDEQDTVPPAEGKRRTTAISTVPGGEPTPQTIHLKRPSVSPLEETGVAEPASEAPTVIKTAQEANAPAEGDATAITQRKTIKIKRTERNVAPRTVKLRQSESGAEAAPAAFGRAPVPSEEEAPSPVFFALAAAAAVLVACLVYFMAAQAFGPDLVLPVPASLL